MLPNPPLQLTNLQLRAQTLPNLPNLPNLTRLRLPAPHKHDRALLAHLRDLDLPHRARAPPSRIPHRQSADIPIGLRDLCRRVAAFHGRVVRVWHREDGEGVGGSGGGVVGNARLDGVAVGVLCWLGWVG
ncbi:hypothetical protein NHQ30_001334 [Ciborinia camelliae]|nr:hypothetical protein NHQ30_001334 [Ciborinia camelliae]